MKVLKVRSSHKNSNSKKKKKVNLPFFFILASQNRSHSVLLIIAVHWSRSFLSMDSERLHSMQSGSGRIPMRWRRVTKQTCPTNSANSATAFLLGQSAILAISCFTVYGRALFLVHVSIHFGGCEVDPPPLGTPWATFYTAKWSTTLAYRTN